MKASAKWLKELKNILHRSFKKVKVGRNQSSGNKEVVNNIKLRYKLKNDLDTLVDYVKNKRIQSSQSVTMKIHEIEDKIEEIANMLEDSTAERHATATIIKEHFEDHKTVDGEFSVTKMWKLKKKRSLNNTEVPTAIQNSAGNMICSKNGLR